MNYYLLEHGDHMQYGSVRRNGGWLSGAFGVHTTESITDFEGVDPNAENIAAFISRRYQTQRDYGSYHIVADYDSIVDLMPAAYEAWADTTNNPHALSVSGALQAARWKELTPERRRAIVTNMAKAAAMKARQAVNAGLLKRMPPARRITAQQAISGSADGFYGHGETNPGTRYDPGKDFDWNLFLSEYAKAADTKVTTASSIEDIMATLDKEDLANIAHAVWAYDQQGKTPQAWHFQKNIVGLIWGYKGKGQKRDAYWHLLNVGTNLLNTKIKNGKGVAYRWISYIVNDNQNAWDTKRLVEELAKKSGVDVAQIEQAMSNVLQAEMPELLAENAVDVEVTINPKEKI